MKVSRNTSRCIIAASVLLLSSTTFISTALAQNVFTGGVLVLPGENTFNDDFDLSTRATVFIDDFDNATLTGNIVTNNHNLTFDTYGIGRVTGNIDGGSGFLDKRGPGTLAISGVPAICENATDDTEHDMCGFVSKPAKHHRQKRA